MVIFCEENPRYTFLTIKSSLRLHIISISSIFRVLWEKNGHLFGYKFNGSRIFFLESEIHWHFRHPWYKHKYKTKLGSTTWLLQQPGASSGRVSFCFNYRAGLVGNGWYDIHDVFFFCGRSTVYTYFIMPQLAPLYLYEYPIINVINKYKVVKCKLGCFLSSN
jgi:hypothetical protein